MAEAVLEVVLDNLSSLIRKEVSIFLGFDQDLKSLASLLTTIKATLEDAEEKQFSDRAIKDWLQKLKDAAYVLDDILDECNTLALESEGSKLQNSFLSSIHPKHVGFRYKLAKKMKRIRERLDEIAAERNKFHLTEIIRERRSKVIGWRESTSIITQPQVYGRDEEKDQIVDFLICEASEREDLSVYPLIGIGGLGKTTLAQLIFNHEKIINHFELRIWVCVSEDFSLKRMAKAIIGSTLGNAHGCEDLDLEPLLRRLQDLLQRKRYLLVFDDLWDEEQENWQRLKSVLACGGKGASVLVTTRLPKVAEIMGTMPPHNLSILSDKDCWELFTQRAFGPNEVECAKLVAIGKEILKKCGGVPLAALALGSLLRFKREEEEWLYVKESNLWSLQGDNSVMLALRLSYLHLPVKLRQCFAFCALFRKDERISKQLLIELWMANGFISSNEMLDGEDFGNKVWNCLNLPELQKLPSLKYLKISNMRHVIYLCEVSYDGEVGGLMALEALILEMLPNLMKLSREDGKNMFPRLSKLRVTKCPNLLDLPCLPYLSDLCIKGKYNQDLPSSFHKFTNLESLHFSDNEELTCFPDGILRNLTSLKELGFHRHSKLELLPTEIINLDALQKLYISQCGSIQSLTDQVLQGLHSLKVLEIFDCHKFNLSTSFQYLTCLETLMIGSCSKVDGFHNVLQYMTTLQSLTLSDLPNLLSLPDCLGNLSSLNKLRIYACPKLTCLPTTFQRLSRLTFFGIYGCPELEKRYRKEIGEGWPQIAHVQHILIRSGEKIRRGGDGRFSESDAGFSQSSL